ncbi:MAG: hypothetical protein JF615_16075, partial [Asticcacaulis sp.]|nr:hypothetical protein [Asticcacaulis sp.]
MVEPAIALARPSLRRTIIQVTLLSAAVLLLAAALLADERWVDERFVPDTHMSRGELLVHVWIARAVVGGTGIVLLGFLRPLARIAPGRSLRNLALAALPSCVAVVMSVCAAELMLRVIGDRLDPGARHEQPLRLTDQEIGWIVRPNGFVADQVAGREVAYAFDRHGMRVRAPGDLVDRARPTILFTGESIMMGYGLTWKETIPAQVEART